MYARLYELSRLRKQREPWEMLNEGMPDVYDRGMAVCFDKQARYVGIKSYRKRDVVYRSGPPNGTDLTPCCKLAEKPEKTFARLGRAVTALSEAAQDGALLTWLTAVSGAWGDVSTFVEDYERHKEADGVDTDHRAYIFLARMTGTSQSIEPIYLSEDAKSLLVDLFLTMLDKGTRQRGTCFACGMGDREVFGNFSTLACYNLDKKGTIAGGFHVKTRPARNFPICGECAVPLADTVAFAKSRLATSYAGLSYMVLPAAATEEGRRYLLSELEDRPQRFSLGGLRDLLAREEDLLGALTDAESGAPLDSVSFSLIFFAEDNASWRIQAEVQQVLPSRVRELWAAVDDVAHDELLMSVKSSGRGKSKTFEHIPLRINTFTLSSLSGDDLAGKASVRLLREWLAALFAGRSVDRTAFVHQVVRAVLATWKKDPKFGPARTIQAWGALRFALLTGLISGAKNMQPEHSASPYGAFCADNGDFFGNQELMTAFLMGCYCSVVASVQRRERGAAPFAKKYQGKLMNGRYLKRLYHEGRTKLAQYRALGIVAKDLDPDVAESFVACGDEWKLSDDETTFAFNLGLSLQYRIYQRSGAALDLPAPDDEAE